MKKRRTNMHPEDIKAAVHKQGSSLSDIGRKNGFKAVTTRAAIRRPIPRANKVIANFLNMSCHDIWPEWFSENDVRLKGAPDAHKSTHNKTMCHRQKRVAA